MVWHPVRCCVFFPPALTTHFNLTCCTVEFDWWPTSVLGIREMNGQRTLSILITCRERERGREGEWKGMRERERDKGRKKGSERERERKKHQSLAGERKRASHLVRHGRQISLNPNWSVLQFNHPQMWQSLTWSGPYTGLNKQRVCICGVCVWFVCVGAVTPPFIFEELAKNARLTNGIICYSDVRQMHSNSPSPFFSAHTDTQAHTHKQTNKNK